MTEYSDAFSRFILVKSTKFRFSCLEHRYMPQIVSKSVPLDSLHHKEHKIYLQYDVKMNIFWSEVAKSTLVADRKILFWRATKWFDINNCLSKKRFSVSYEGTFGHPRWKYIHFHTVLYIIMFCVSYDVRNPTVPILIQSEAYNGVRGRKNKIWLILPKWSVRKRQNILPFWQVFTSF